MDHRGIGLVLRRVGDYWLLLTRTDVSVFLRHPRFEIDLLVSADIATFYRMWLGRISMGEALRGEAVRLRGTPAFVRAFAQWFSWSPMADTVRAAARQGARS